MAPPSPAAPLSALRLAHVNEEADATAGPVKIDGVIACEACDLVHRDTPLARGERALCQRCGTPLAGGAAPHQALSLALTLAAMVTFVIAQTNPIASLQAQGIAQSSTLWQAVVTLWMEDAWVMSLLVLLTTLLFPAFELLALCHLLLSLRERRLQGDFVLALRLMKAVEPWVMIEVFMLGLLVAVVKLTSIASVIPGAGLWAFGALMVLLAAASSTLDHAPLWKAFDDELA